MFASPPGYSLVGSNLQESNKAAHYLAYTLYSRGGERVFTDFLTSILSMKSPHV